MENIFMKVYFYVNLKGKKISITNENKLKAIITEVKIIAQKMVEEQLEKEEK